MKISNKAIGVVALMAAVVVLQLGVAPTPAMARELRQAAANETIVMVTGDGAELHQVYCNER
jgi:hypothetical protein